MLRALIVGVAIALAACGSEPPPPVALEDYPVSGPDALCAWAVRCEHMPDDATCRRFIDPKAYDIRRAVDALAQGRLSYDADAAGACLASIENAHCLETPFIHESCARLFVGLVAEGGACSSSFECADNADCLDALCEGQCCVGACGPPVRVDPPLPLAGRGESCMTHFDCEERLYCETDGVCTETPTEVGERCLFGCASGNLYCDVMSLTCKANARLGEACDASGESAPPCDNAWAYCGDDSRCAPRPGAGEVCDDIDRRCVPTANCEVGLCVARGGPGEACAMANECEVTCDRGRGECVAYETCEL